MFIAGRIFGISYTPIAQGCSKMTRGSLGQLVARTSVVPPSCLRKEGTAARTLHHHHHRNMNSPGAPFSSTHFSSYLLDADESPLHDGIDDLYLVSTLGSGEHVQLPRSPGQAWAAPQEAPDAVPQEEEPEEAEPEEAEPEDAEPVEAPDVVKIKKRTRTYKPRPGGAAKVRRIDTLESNIQRVRGAIRRTRDFNRPPNATLACILYLINVEPVIDIPKDVDQRSTLHFHMMSHSALYQQVYELRVPPENAARRVTLRREFLSAFRGEDLSMFTADMIVAALQ